MNHYLLLLRNSPAAFEGLKPEQYQEVYARYKAWRTKITDAGVYAGSNKLESATGRILRGGNGKVSVTDGPFTESKEVIGGYFMITAETYDDALAIARDCPHLDFGTVEVRLVEKLQPSA
jgi:hypothetical protein